MTKEQLAEMLNGREYTKEMTPAEEKAAKESGLVVIFGASDDLCELRGAIYDERGAYKEALLLIGSDGTLLPEIEDYDIGPLKRHRVLGFVKNLQANATKVKVLWCATPEYSWTYETDAPHASFDVIEKDEADKYCRGIVIDLKELGA